MKASRSSGKPENRRGSPEAIEKRRVARLFNDVLGGRGSGARKHDGRTEKRRQRLLRELESGKGRGAHELKPLDVQVRVNELLDLGEPLRAFVGVTDDVLKAAGVVSAEPKKRARRGRLGT